MKNIKLDFLWEILCEKPTKVWLALPIEAPNQEVLKVDIPKRPDKKIKKELYYYIFFQLSRTTKINAQIILKLNKISKYKESKKQVNNRFLKNNSILQTDKIKPLALKLQDPRKFYNWIIKNIKFPKNLSKYLVDLNWTENAFNVLNNKEGECTGKSLLFVSLCRSIGIPARIVNGYFLKSGNISLLNSKVDKKSLEIHTWAEFFDGAYWIPVDCSLAREEKKDYFGEFEDYRITVSKDMNFRLIRNGIIPFLQIGEIKPKDSINSNIKTKIRVR